MVGISCSIAARSMINSLFPAVIIISVGNLTCTACPGEPWGIEQNPLSAVDRLDFHRHVCRGHHACLNPIALEIPIFGGSKFIKIWHPGIFFSKVSRYMSFLEWS